MDSAPNVLPTYLHRYLLNNLELGEKSGKVINHPYT